MFDKSIDYIILLIPMLTGIIISSICPMSGNSGSTVPFRPPSWVFGVVWTILYLLLGISWVIARDDKKQSMLVDIFYSLITFSLILWIIIYSCMNQKVNAIYVFSLCFFSIISALFLGNLTSKITLLPLLIWLIYAFSLNTFESVTNV